MSQHPLVEAYLQGLREHADPKRAKEMAAYMKTEMPFYGVASPTRKTLFKGFTRRYPLDAEQYQQCISELWAQPHREAKYGALWVAENYKKVRGPEHIELYERLVQEGAWWDFVDWLAGNIIGRVYLTHRHELEPHVDRWVHSEDMWLRRTSLLVHLKHKSDTDETRLFAACRALMHEKEFFIRKAIGWALRQYSYVAPEAVNTFLKTEKDNLSGLSYREGRRILLKRGQAD